MSEPTMAYDLAIIERRGLFSWCIMSGDKIIVLSGIACFGEGFRSSDDAKANAYSSGWVRARDGAVYLREDLRG